MILVTFKLCSPNDSMNRRRRGVQIFLILMPLLVTSMLLATPISLAFRNNSEIAVLLCSVGNKIGLCTVVGAHKPPVTVREVYIFLCATAPQDHHSESPEWVLQS